MLFEQPFWPHDFFDVICTDSFIPEFWVTNPPTQHLSHSAAAHINSADQHPAAAFQSGIEAQQLPTANSSGADQRPAVLAQRISSNDQQPSAPHGASQQPPVDSNAWQVTADTAEASSPSPVSMRAPQQQSIFQEQLVQQYEQPKQSQRHRDWQQAGTADQPNLPVTGQQQQQAQQAQQEQQQQHQQAQQEQQQQAQQAQQAQQQSGQSGRQQNGLPVPDVHCMVGFVAGSKAEEISKMSQTAVIMNTLAQLDTMFGKDAALHCRTALQLRL